MATPTGIPSTAAAGPPHGGAPTAHRGASLADAKAAMVLVHGRGASAESILEIAGVLARPELCYLAPGASTQTAYPHAWYPRSFMAERELNEPGLSSGLRAIGALVEGIEEAGIPRERILLLGFSQGACLAGEFAWRHPARYGGVILFSGGLIGPEGTSWEPHGSMEGTPVLLGCSDVDAHIPETRVHESARAFEAMGAEVDTRIYPGMGHLVNRDEIEGARALIDQVLEV